MKASYLNGRRLRAVAVALLIVCASVGLPMRGAPRGARRNTAGAQSGAAANPFGVQFQDVTHAAGIHFHHERATSEQKLYLETMGAGVAWIDYNQDVFLYAVFVNSGYTPFFHPESPPQPALYRNNGDGTFTDRAPQGGIRANGTFFFGVAVAAFRQA